jgi:ABC-2 type transport system permease protein
VDRVIALVLLRLKTELRALSYARERMVGALIAVPGLLLSSLVLSAFAFFGLRALERASPESALTLVAGLATGIGLLWALSPVVSGVAFAESHDMSRLLHFPIPLRDLVTSSLLANLVQPMTLAQAPVLVAAAAALCGSPLRLPLALAGLSLSFVLTLAVAQAAGLLFHGFARNRRFQDVALFLGLALGFLMSALPLLVLAGGAPGLRLLLALARAFEWLPFAWGARAAVHAGRGELYPFLGFSALGVVAIAGAMAASALLIQLVYRGELDLGVGVRGAASRARMPLSGPLGALLEKDLRSAWRDPGLRATLVLGLLGPALILFFLTQSNVAGRAGPAVLLLASFVGLSAFGSNALGFERRGLGLLLSFPIARWRVLVGKNAAALLLRIPGLLTLALASLLTAPLALAPAALAIAVATFLIAAGVDNFFAILFPVTAPAPGKNPYAQASGGRGLGTALLSGVFLMGAAALAAPFAVLAWLPLWLQEPLLWLIALPLAIAGAVAVYAMLIAGAARLLERREPEVLERVLGEA